MYRIGVLHYSASELLYSPAAFSKPLSIELMMKLLVPLCRHMPIAGKFVDVGPNIFYECNILCLPFRSHYLLHLKDNQQSISCLEVSKFLPITSG